MSQAGGFGRTRFDAADAGVPALGYVTDYGVLTEKLRFLAQELFTSESIPARCSVHAEGIADAVEKRYAQHALVALVHAEPPAQSTAFERFTAEGPLALLPFAGRHAVVWSLPPERAQFLAACPERDFLDALAAAAGRRAGSPVKVEMRTVQPLVLRVRRARTAARSVYIGNAAQTLHPVAGQGLNLGLRDAWDLAQALRGAADPGAAAVLERVCCKPQARCRGDDPRHRLACARLPRLEPRRARRARRGTHGARPAARAATLLCAAHDLRTVCPCHKKSQADKIPSPSQPKPSEMKIGAHALRNALFVAPMAGITDRPFRRLAQALRRRARGLRDGLLAPRAARFAQDAGCASTMPARKARFRCRSPVPSLRDARRGRPPQRRARRRRSSTSTWAARRRRCAIARPARPCSRTSALVGAHPGGGRRGGGRARHAQDPHRPAAGAAQRARDRPHRGGGRRADARRPRPHARLRLRRPGRVRDDRRGEGQRAHPGDRQRRHRSRPADAKRVLALTAPTA